MRRFGERLWHDPRRELRRQVRQAAHDLPRSAALGLALCLSFSLAIGGFASSQAWVRGGHVTADHLTYHQWLGRLGFPHHHGPPIERPASRSGEPGETGEAPEAPLPPSVMALDAGVPQVSAIPPDGTPRPDTGLSVLPASAAAAPRPDLGRGATLIDVPGFPGIRPLPPELPPRLGR
jgi:hypothetical protein